MNNINFNKLKKFITEARKNTYAGNREPVKNPILAGSSQFEYKKSEYFYRDIYFSGKKNFIGQEVIYLKNKPIWSMIYCGYSEPREVYAFLKKSLLMLSEKCRFGGECKFEENNFQYRDKGKGTIERFDGEEQMFIKRQSVYRLKYQGGLISK